MPHAGRRHDELADDRVVVREALDHGRRPETSMSSVAVTLHVAMVLRNECVPGIFGDDAKRRRGGVVELARTHRPHERDEETAGHARRRRR